MATSYWRDFPQDGAAARREGLSRHFYFSLMLFYAVVAVIGFVPSLVGFARGTFPMSMPAHVHGVLMMSWLLLLVAQSALPARGHVRRHQRLGAYAAVFAALIWVSMVVMTLRSLVIFDPQPGNFVYNILLLQTMIVLLFPLFFGWALLARRAPGWHKRLMVITALLPLQASIDRMFWMPRGEGQQWENFLYLDLLLLPLFLFDLKMLRRVHPATAIGTTILAATQLVALMLWNNPAWHQLAHGLTSGLR